MKRSSGVSLSGVLLLIALSLLGALVLFAARVAAVPDAVSTILLGTIVLICANMARRTLTEER